MKEIGGYFQLEEMPGEEYYPDLYRVNLGRTALLWLLKSRWQNWWSIRQT